MPAAAALMQVQGLSAGAGARTILRDLDFEVRRGEVLAVMGPSGCGKSTLVRHLVGLQRPLAGRVLLEGQDLHAGDEAARGARCRRFGVMFQAGALWSSMSLGDNLMLPMRLFTALAPHERQARARSLLALVGLEGGFGLMPAELSGGMRKRAALARALALDPPLLILDEPGSGLDPLNVARLDRLVLELRHHLGKTVVMVTHDVGSVRAVADRALYLDEQEMTMTALGPPQELLDSGPPAVRRFLAPAGVAADGSPGSPGSSATAGTAGSAGAADAAGAAGSAAPASSRTSAGGGA